jgi:hypothetical protein
MADYFEAIGFTLERPGFESELQRALAEGEHLVAPRGDYHRWHIGDAELWVTMYRLGKRRELAGANPHFESGARMSILVERLDRNEEFPLEGECYAWAMPPDSENDADAHGIYPFSASLPDYDLVASQRTPPFRASLALAGFVNTVESWNDEAAFAHAQRREGETLSLASQSFVPVGLLGKYAGRARSHALVTGRVTASKALANAATGRPYRAQLPELPNPGAIVRANCWLSGRLVSS